MAMQVTGDTHQRLAEELDELEKLGAQTPSFRIANLSNHEAEVWLKSETRRLEQLARTTGELHAR